MTHTERRQPFRGTLKWVETRLVPLRNPRGKILSVMGIARDITERKQAEQLLRASQERFRQLAENIREVFWITNPAKTEMLYISPGYEEIWGRSWVSVVQDKWRIQQNYQYGQWPLRLYGGVI